MQVGEALGPGPSEQARRVARMDEDVKAFDGLIPLVAVTIADADCALYALD